MHHIEDSVKELQKLELETSCQHDLSLAFWTASSSQADMQEVVAMS